MKILFLTTHFNTGGITSYLLNLTKGLVQDGHEVIVISSGGNCVDELKSLQAADITYDLKTKSELSPKIYLQLNQLIRLIKEESIDLIHAQTRITQVMAHCAHKLCGIPVVTTCHGFFRPRWSRRKFHCWGQRVIAISDDVFSHLKSDFHLPQEQMALVPHGIDIDAFPLIDEQRRVKTKREMNLKGPVVGIISRLSDVKGISFLIEAMQDVISKFPQAQCLIVGEGKEEKLLRNKVSDLCLQESIHFYPIVNQTPKMLSAFDVFVMPSLKEGLGLSVMEAQAMGLPVVASRVGGLKTLIQEGKTGFLVLPADKKALTLAINHVLSHPQQAAAMGSQARMMIEERFSLKQMTEKTLAVYQEVVR